ncbi:uncharacterized protein VTP21DRAFT_6945 [Calcarisporiella thermophila]|uniref:uncharacterized protein n=1 Tax=Calcarisporiella thermophila TaxID=911321 RepID=UPI0037443997
MATKISKSQTTTALSMAQVMLRRIVQFSILALFGYVSIIIALSFDQPQRAVIYMNWINLPYVDMEFPEMVGFPKNKVRNFKIQTADGARLGAWHVLPTTFFQANRLNLTQDSYIEALRSEPTVLYFHGNAGNRAMPWRVNTLRQLSEQLNVNVIAIDYRGFGDSEGAPTEEGLYLDGRATWDWLIEKGVAPNTVSILGHSLGTGVATWLSSNLTAENTPPRATILIAPYSSIPEVMFEYRLLKFLPVLSPLKSFPYARSFLISQLKHRFDSLSRIKNISGSILFLHGKLDEEIPPRHSHLLLSMASSGKGVNSTDVERVIYPDEGELYLLRKDGHSTLGYLELKWAHHNNVPFYDLTFKAIKDFMTTV